MSDKLMYQFSIALKELLSWIRTNKASLDAYKNKSSLQVIPGYIGTDTFYNDIDSIFNAERSEATDSFYLSQIYFTFKSPTGWELTKYGKQIICQVFERYFEMYCVETYALEDEVIDKYVASILNKIFIITNNTYEKYSSILEAYEDKKGHLLAGISATSNGLVRFNDTPQDEGDFADDEHTSNITQSESTIENDAKTPIERIAEIERNYKTTLLRWSNEYNRMFWWED